MLHPIGESKSFAPAQERHKLPVVGNYWVVLGKGIKGRVQNGWLNLYGLPLERLLPYASFDDTTPAPEAEEREILALLTRLGLEEAELTLTKENVQLFSDNDIISVRTPPHEKTLKLSAEKKGWLVEIDMTESEYKDILIRFWELAKVIEASYIYSKEKGLYLP